MKIYLICVVFLSYKMNSLNTAILGTGQGSEIKVEKELWNYKLTLFSDKDIFFHPKEIFKTEKDFDFKMNMQNPIQMKLN